MSQLSMYAPIEQAILAEYFGLSIPSVDDELDWWEVDPQHPQCIKLEPDAWDGSDQDKAMANAVARIALARVQKSLAYSVNRTIDAGLLLSSVERKGITDLYEFAKSRRANQADRLGEYQFSDIVQLQLNGRNAFRFEVAGTLKTGARLKYMMTIIEGKDEIALLNTWASPTNFDQNRPLFEQLASMVTGL